MSFRFYIPTKILIGSNCLDALHKERMPGKKALIVMSAGRSVIENGSMDRLLHQLSMARVEYAVFNKVRANPTRSQVMEGADMAGCEGCDFIVALGGGSCIDAAKAIAIVASNGGDLWDYFHGGTAKGQPIKNKMLPVIAVGTTAGTGSEVDQWMVVSNPEHNEKIGFGYSKSFPVLAVVDPTLMLSIPPGLTALQGIDALLHAVEGYISSEANAFSDALAIKSIELIGGNLSEAVRNGSNLEARERMAEASTLSGMILAVTSMVAEHALGEGLSGIHHDLPHGTGLVLIAEAYYKHIAELGHSERRLVEMSRALGNKNAKNGADFANALVALLKECGIYGMKMSDFGIRREEFPEIVKLAQKHAVSEFAAEKKPLTYEECLGILENSYR